MNQEFFPPSRPRMRCARRSPSNRTRRSCSCENLARSWAGRKPSVYLCPLDNTHPDGEPRPNNREPFTTSRLPRSYVSTALQSAGAPRVVGARGGTLQRGRDRMSNLAQAADLIMARGYAHAEYPEADMSRDTAFSANTVRPGSTFSYGLALAPTHAP